MELRQLYIYITSCTRCFACVEGLRVVTAWEIDILLDFFCPNKDQNGGKSEALVVTLLHPPYRNTSSRSYTKNE